MPTQTQRRSRGGALLTVLVMLFARRYTLALIWLLTYIAAVGVSFYLTLNGIQLGGIVVFIVAVFRFFYAGLRTNKRFEKDRKLTDIETGVFVKAVDRIGFVLFIIIVLYLLVLLGVAYFGRNMFGEMALNGSTQGGSADYQALFEQLQGTNTTELEANLSDLNELLQGMEDLQNAQ